MTKKKDKKKLTLDFSNMENTHLIEGKQAFYILHEIRNTKGISISELCRKVGISNTSYHRYLRYYEKQQRNSPPLSILNKFSDALGCKIVIVEKNIENSDFEASERKYVNKSEYNINNKIVKYKLLPVELLDKLIAGKEFQIHIRKHIGNDKLYDIFVSRIETPNDYEYSNGRVGAEYVYDIMEKYKINPFNVPYKKR